MLTQQYVEMLFDTLESALEHGVIEDWSVKCGKFVVVHDGERVAVSQQDAAAYVTKLLSRRIELAEAKAIVKPTKQTVRRGPEPTHWLRFAIS